MADTESRKIIAFVGGRSIAAGFIAEVALQTKNVVDRGVEEPVLVFDLATSKPVELDLRGTAEDVEARYPAPERTDAEVGTASEAPKRRGRPKLGVVGREVTLLPRHWQWLGEQPGGASVTLRKLVDRARRENAAGDRRRKAQESTYRFITVMAGDRPGFEEAMRALYAGRAEDFRKHSEAWPVDVRDHSRNLAAVAFGTEEAPS